jgi:hypothetical protein
MINYVDQIFSFILWEEIKVMKLVSLVTLSLLCCQWQEGRLLLVGNLQSSKQGNPRSLQGSDGIPIMTTTECNVGASSSSKSGLNTASPGDACANIKCVLKFTFQ